jgi:hypothetical protein
MVHGQFFGRGTEEETPDISRHVAAQPNRGGAGAPSNSGLARRTTAVRFLLHQPIQSFFGGLLVAAVSID